MIMRCSCQATASIKTLPSASTIETRHRLAAETARDTGRRPASSSPARRHGNRPQPHSAPPRPRRMHSSRRSRPEHEIPPQQEPLLTGSPAVAQLGGEFSARIVVIRSSGAHDMLLIQKITDIDRQIRVLGNLVIEGCIKQGRRLALAGVIEIP